MRDMRKSIFVYIKQGVIIGNISSRRLHGAYGARHKELSGRRCVESAGIALVRNNKMNPGTRTISVRSARRRKGVNQNSKLLSLLGRSFVLS